MFGKNVSGKITKYVAGASFFARQIKSIALPHPQTRYRGSKVIIRDGVDMSFHSVFSSQLFIIFQTIVAQAATRDNVPVLFSYWDHTVNPEASSRSCTEVL